MGGGDARGSGPGRPQLVAGERRARPRPPPPGGTPFTPCQPLTPCGITDRGATRDLSGQPEPLKREDLE